MTFSEYTPNKEQRVLVFAYGSNMDPLQMWKRCPSASVIGKGRLYDYTTGYTKWSSSDDSGAKNIREYPGKNVDGIIWDIPNEELDKLNIWEEGYKAETLSVYSYEDDEFRDCIVYVSPIIGDFKPSVSYINKIKKGETFMKELPTYKLKSFREHINEATVEGKNTHMMHINNAVIYGGAMKLVDQMSFSYANFSPDVLKGWQK